MNLIVGNIIALVASVIMVLSGYIKNKDKIIFVQAVQIGLSVISNAVLGGITGAIINFISFIRNVLCYKNRFGIKEKLAIILVSTALSLIFNNIGFIGVLPLVSTIVYTLFMDTKDVIKLKVLIIFTMVLWLIYDLYIKSYTSAIFDFANIIANIISIFQIKYKNKKV